MHYNYVRNQNGIYTICTGTLDKGGIDHSPSSFREIKVDANDNITTQLRYAFIEPQIAIVSPMNNQTAAASPSLKISFLFPSIHIIRRQKRLTFLIS